jgi:hypothetical protein
VFQKRTAKGGTGQYVKWIECFTALKNVLESTSYLLLLASKTTAVLLNAMKNLCEHQLSSVCVVVPFWLAVK